MASSAGTYNRVSLIGYQAAEPKKHSSEKGSAVTFPLMTHELWKGKEGIKQRKTDFHRIVFFGNFGEKLFPSLAKGKKLFVEGELHNHSYVTSDGEKKYSSEITGDTIVFLDRKASNGKGNDEDDGDEDGEVEES